MNELDRKLLKNLLDEWTNCGQHMERLQFRNKVDVLYWLKEKCRYDEAAKMQLGPEFSLCGTLDGLVWVIQRSGLDRSVLHDYQRTNQSP